MKKNKRGTKILIYSLIYYLVKAMYVMYGCESWTIKKAEQ